ncbi:MAG: FAD-dependent oxidoreductase [Acidimicrobiales bacterium]
MILATGSAPVVPPIEGLREIDYLTNETLFSLAALPRRLAVLGGGAMGCEMGQAFARLGSTVTVIEAERRLLPREEPEASAVIADAFAADGVALATDARLERVAPCGDGVAWLHLASGTTRDADRVLVAVGRHPSTGVLGQDALGVARDEVGHIRTDATLATSVPGIWAVGDVRAHAVHPRGRPHGPRRLDAAHVAGVAVRLDFPDRLPGRSWWRPSAVAAADRLPRRHAARRRHGRRPRRAPRRPAPAPGTRPRHQPTLHPHRVGGRGRDRRHAQRPVGHPRRGA